MRGLLLNFAWGLANCRQACQIINGRMCEIPTSCCSAVVLVVVVVVIVIVVVVAVVVIA